MKRSETTIGMAAFGQNIEAETKTRSFRSVMGPIEVDKDTWRHDSVVVRQMGQSDEEAISISATVVLGTITNAYFHFINLIFLTINWKNKITVQRGDVFSVLGLAIAFFFSGGYLPVHIMRLTGSSGFFSNLQPP